MKGKKFDAAQRHFEKERVAYERKINLLQNHLNTAYKDLKSLNDRYMSLEYENEKLNEWLERLLEYTELPKRDIKIACDRDKRISQIFKMLTGEGANNEL